MSYAGIVLPFLQRDSFTLTRHTGGVDSEGVPVTTWTTVGTFTGAWGSPGTRDLEIAARADQSVDAVVAGEFPARVGDKIVGLRGEDYLVTHVRQLITHRRAFLRQVS